MRKTATHYDNLQVSRSASDLVIRAAYKSLSQKYHPDNNQDDPHRAERIMKIINKAYEVLSDPDKRREHDAWIARQEAQTADATAPPQSREDKPKRKRSSRRHSDARTEASKAPAYPRCIICGVEAQWGTPNGPVCDAHRAKRR